MSPEDFDAALARSSLGAPGMLELDARTPPGVLATLTTLLTAQDIVDDAQRPPGGELDMVTFQPGGT